MAVVVFDSRKVFTSKVFDSFWLCHEARVTDKLKPEAVSLMGFEIMSWDEEVYKSILASLENPGREYNNFTYQEFVKPPVVAGKLTPNSHANWSVLSTAVNGQPRISWENSRHFAMPTQAYWWHVTTQIWVVLLIGWSKFSTRYDQLETLPSSGWWHVISMEFLNSFLRRFFSGKRVVALWNVGCFLRLASVPNWNQSSVLKNYETWIKGNLFCSFILSFKWWTWAKQETESETLS